MILGSREIDDGDAQHHERVEQGSSPATAVPGGGRVTTLLRGRQRGGGCGGVQEVADGEHRQRLAGERKAGVSGRTLVRRHGAAS
jgi:hypothetical protein